MTGRFMDAVLSLRYQQLEALLCRSVPVNTKNRLGQTPVMVACYIPDEDKGYRMFKFLLRKGADILETDNQRTSVFQHACRKGRERIARKIVREMGVAGADLAGQDLSGHTPLFDAVTSGKVSLVRFIVRLMRERSLGVDMPNNAGTTPLIQAHKMGLADVAAVLEKDGNANPRICDGERHMNAAEWADEAARRRVKAQALLRERTRERQMIYSRYTNQKLSPVLSSIYAKKSPSLPDIRPRWHTETMNTKSDTTGGKNWNGESQRIAERNSNRVARKSLDINMQNVVNKSMGTAMTMLDLASKTSKKRRFAKSFVSSEFDTSKAGEYGNLKLASVNSLLAVYSNQLSSSFRKPAKPPPELIPDPPMYEKKASTLAYIMGRGPRPKGRHTPKEGVGHYKTPSRRNSKLKMTSRRNSASSTGLGVKSSSGNGGSVKKVNVNQRKSPDEILPKEGKLLSEHDEPSLTGQAQRSGGGNKAGEGDREGDQGGGGKPVKKSKTLQPPRLSRVPEDDQGRLSQHPVPQRINPRDSLPNIRVTVPSA